MIGYKENFNETSNSNIIQTINFDFTQRVYDMEYYDLLDLLSKLGGLRASILPLIGYIIPLLSLHFFYKLAEIIS